MPLSCAVKRDVFTSWNLPFDTVQAFRPRPLAFCAKILWGFLVGKVFQVMSIVDPMFAFWAACMFSVNIHPLPCGCRWRGSLFYCFFQNRWLSSAAVRVSRSALVLKNWKAKELQVLQNPVFLHFAVVALRSRARHSQNWRQPLHPQCIISKKIRSSSDPNWYTFWHSVKLSIWHLFWHSILHSMWHLALAV